MLLAAWALIVMGGGLLAYTAYAGARAVRIRRWPCVEGRVVYHEVVEHRGTGVRANAMGDWCEPTIHYGYVVNRTRHENSSLGYTSQNGGSRDWASKRIRDLVTDGSVRVYYNPKNPGESYLDVSVGLLGILVCTAIAAAMIAAGVVALGRL